MVAHQLLRHGRQHEAPAQHVGALTSAAVRGNRQSVLVLLAHRTGWTAAAVVQRMSAAGGKQHDIAGFHAKRRFAFPSGGSFDHSLAAQQHVIGEFPLVRLGMLDPPRRAEVAPDIQPSGDRHQREQSVQKFHVRRLSMKLRKYGIKELAAHPYTDSHAIRHG